MSLHFVEVELREMMERMAADYSAENTKLKEEKEKERKKRKKQ